MHCRRRRSAGFSLIELLLVIALLAILAAVVLPSSNPTIHDQLNSAARIVATDLAYARSLAVTHGSTYRVVFDVDENRYVLEHSAIDNPALDTLPDSVFRDPDDPPDQHVVELDDLPRMGVPVRIHAAAEVDGVGNIIGPVGDVEFGPLGQTMNRSGHTLIWLSAGKGPSQRYIMLYVNPVTGLATVGQYSGDGPPPWLVP